MGFVACKPHDRLAIVTNGDAPKRARSAAAALAAAVIAAFVTMYLPQPLLPDLTRELVIAPATSAAIISVVTLGIAIASPFLAPLSDRFGRRPVLLTATFGLAPVGIATALVDDVGWLLLLRGVQGALVAVILASGLAYLGEEFGRAIASRLTGLFIASTVTGGVVSRLLGGVLGDAFGWRVAFASAAVVSLLAGFTLARLLPPARNFRRAIHLGSAFRGALAHWRDPRLRALYLIGFAVFYSFLALFNALPFRLNAAPYELAPRWIGLTYLVYLAGVASATFSGPLLDRLRASHLLAMALAVTALAHLATLATSLSVLVTVLLALTFAHFLAQSTASGLVTLSAREARAGANAHYLFSYYVGGSIGSLVSVAMLPVWGWSAVAGVNAVLLGAAALLALRLADEAG